MILVVYRPDGTTEEHRFAGEVTVGRDPQCSVVLSDLSVSRRHARFFFHRDQPAVEDLGSSNGVWVNGGRITAATAIGLDVEIRIGDFTITLAEGEPVRRAPKRTLSGRSEARETVRRSEPRVIAATEPQSIWLRGLTDRFEGEIFALINQEIVVGRVPPAEIAIDHQSVSRRHAELRRRGAGYAVFDLDSANGTFVNRRRVRSGGRALGPGDVITFGQVDWRYDGPPGDRIIQRINFSPRMGIVAVAALVVIIATVVAARMKASATRKAAPIAEVAKPPPEDPAVVQARADRAREQGKGYLEQGAWQKAIDQLKVSLELDPVNSEVQRLLRQAQKELKMKERFDEGRSKMDVSAYEDALEAMLEIEPESYYYRRARVEVGELAQRVLANLKPQCLTYSKAKNWDVAQKLCAKHMDLACHLNGDREVLAALQSAEKALKVSAERRWSCPEKLRHWLTERSAAEGPDLKTELLGRYKDPDLATALLVYAKDGMTLQSIDALKRLRSNPGKAKQRRTVDELITQLKIINGKFLEGSNARTSGDLKRSDAEWRQALDVDQKIMPKRPRSFVNQQIRSLISGDYYKAGRKLYDQRRFAEAFAAWERGITFDDSNTAILEGVLQLEGEARRALDDSPACWQIADVLKYTRAQPESPAHQRAAQMAIDRKCGK